ncbi:Uncharacterised protein [Clostridium putrefaciens]|uniref:Lipoprotein n=1 Tax=Clostridium putrefaciens TaxID=99675 RepID=A0A381J484_9CLOT|nr:hypothetical protein [Clostridium putrefaciens]SUY44941.1 Uncharacterised protein [Clostridium putrefaciens]
MIKQKKIIAGVLLGVSLFSCITASAATYVSKGLTGRSSESSFAYLGSGSRNLKGTCTEGKGIARAVQIKSWAPDPVVASVTLNNGNSATVGFTSQSHATNGEVQSYYLRWNGTSSNASADLSLTD